MILLKGTLYKTFENLASINLLRYESIVELFTYWKYLHRNVFPVSQITQNFSFSLKTTRWHVKHTIILTTYLKEYSRKVACSSTRWPSPEYSNSFKNQSKSFVGVCLLQSKFFALEREQDLQAFYWWGRIILSNIKVY